MAWALQGSIRDKDVRPILAYIDEARKVLQPWEATSDDLLQALLIAILEETNG